MTAYYRNTFSGRVVEKDEPDPLLERAAKWRRIDEAEAKPKSKPGRKPKTEDRAWGASTERDTT